MDRHIHILFDAIKQNDVNKVKTLMDRTGFDLNSVDSIGTCPLQVAVGHNYHEMVKLLVDNGASVNNRKAIITPLILAINAGFLEMAKLLIDLGANVNEGWLDGETFIPLRSAASCLNYKMTKLLIDNGANVHIKSPRLGATLLHEVGFYTNPDCPQDPKFISLKLKIAKLYLQNKLDVNAKGKDGVTPLDMAMKDPNNIELVKLFIKEGAELRRKGYGKNSTDCLVYGVNCNSPELVRLCLERGCDCTVITKINNKPNTCYHHALSQSTPEVVKVFWEFGCPIDLSTAEIASGTTPIELCNLQVNKGTHECLMVQVELISGIKDNNLNTILKAIEKGAVPKGISTAFPSTLHHLAATNGNPEIVRVLLENGVPVNQLGFQMKTCLFFAIASGNLNVMKEILMFGGCFNKNDIEVLKLNKCGKCKEIESTLMEIMKAFQFVRRGSNKIFKLLKRFVSVENREMTKMLMNCVDWRGRSLLGLALSKGHYKLADKLMQFRIEHL